MQRKKYIQHGLPTSHTAEIQIFTNSMDKERRLEDTHSKYIYNRTFVSKQCSFGTQLPRTVSRTNTPKRRQSSSVCRSDIQNVEYSVDHFWEVVHASFHNRPQHLEIPAYKHTHTHTHTRQKPPLSEVTTNEHYRKVLARAMNTRSKPTHSFVTSSHLCRPSVCFHYNTSTTTTTTTTGRPGHHM